MAKKVYLLEDDEGIRGLVECALGMSGLEVASFGLCAEFLAAVENCSPRLAILDIMLPDGSGLEVLKKLKAGKKTFPIMMMSALSSDVDKARGLNDGADDYLAKPFGVLEMTARVSALLRRAGENSSEKENLTVGKLRLDRSARAVSLGENLLELNLKEYELLCYLMENAGVALSRDQILSAVWGYEAGETRTVDNHIARLRKLGVDIETVFGVGYKL